MDGTDASALPDAPRLAAPVGYELADDATTWYRAVVDDAPLADAAADCADDHAGAGLVVIDDAPELAAVDRVIRERLDGQRAWLGITDQDEEGAWRRLDGGEIPFRAWHRGEPNDAGAGEDCALVLGRFDAAEARGRWADAACGQSRPYVCEWKP